MTIEQYKQQLRDCFRNDFVSAEHFIQSVLSPLFHEIKPLYEDDMLSRSEFVQYKTKGLQSVHKVAQITDAFNPIEVYDIVLQDTTNIAVARVYIQQFVRSMAIPYSSAFILFHYANAANRDWRFSYLYKEDTIANITNAKRFTYLFGKEHICRTAEERFVELLQQEHIEKQQLLEAFSVEALSKEFFDQYDRIYQKFCKHIEEHPELFGDVFKQDTTGKTTRDYVKKLLGRITFLCFLQKKRWLNNNLHFMRDLFFKATPEQQANFLDEVLEPLFFDCLNRQRPNDIFNTGVAAIGSVHIPYLNGGLFEREQIDAERSCFPADYFRELLEFFEQFNFTIDENDPNDAEVGVDPEMLGKIFESQLEDNKDKGAFYTPKEIVQYMCRESLIAYLTNCAMENTQHKYPREQTEASVRMLIQTPEQIVPKMNDRQKEDFGKAIRAVKICDPAIGSGAFPMGLLNELVRLRVSIDAWADKPNDIAALKREIIQNNIYGVDIEKGAIDIARLRFWLSIVVDEATPSPLPNFDYKFMQGNSLVTTFGGEYINLDTKEQSHFKVQEMKDEKQQLYNLKKQYYTASGEQKLVLATQIKDSIIKLISMQLGYESRSWVEHHAQLTMFEDAKQLSFDDILQQLPPEKQRVINLCKKLHAQLESNNIALETRAHIDINFFDWRMMFTEVFDNEKPGFDIVIGNPPYIDSETMTRVMPEMRELYAKQFSCAKGNWDMFVLFIELGMRMLASNGVYSFIIPNKLIAAKYTETLRAYIANNTIFEIRDYGNVPVFTNAAVYPATIVGGIGESYVNDINFAVMENVTDKCIDNSIKTSNFANIEFWDICFQPTKYYNLFSKINCHPLLKNDDSYTFIGAATVSEAYLIKDVLKDGDKTCSGIRMVNTGTIDKYTNLWGVSPMQYIKGRYQYPIIEETDLAQISQKRLEQAKSCKIIVAGMSKFIEAIYDEGNTLAGKSTTIILGDSNKLKFLLAILNSNLASFFTRIAYNSLKMAGGFINVGSREMENIPIPESTSSQKQPIIELVDAILALKAEDPLTDTTSLEAQIDQLIYNLYDLTQEEIELIEQ